MASDDRVLTERLVCRPPEPGDIEGYLDVLTDPEVEVRLRPADTAPLDHLSVAERLDSDLAHWKEHGFGPWTLVEQESGLTIGRAGLQWTSIDGREVVELPWAVASRHWNRGFATEAARAAIEWARQLEMPEAVALVTPDNKPSRRVAEKIGMRVEGETVHGGLPHMIYRAPLV